MRSIFSVVAALPLVLAVPMNNADIQNTKYIVVMKPEHPVAQLGIQQEGGMFHNVDVIHHYNAGSFKGFAAYLSQNQVNHLNKDAKVAYVETDGILHTQQLRQRDEDGNSTVSGSRPGLNAGVLSQQNAPWGLARISHRQKGSSEYVYDSSAGEGTCAYIIDTGIYTEHEDFQGRATFVKNYDKVDGSDADMFGHGTHVAGTIGSKTYGVAKKAKLFAMKVCNQYGNCELSDVNAAILQTITDSRQRECPNGVVINMSLGAPNSEWRSIKDAVKQATDAGVFVAVAAGNEAQDAANYSPASSPGACAAGAVDSNDAIASFSNFGVPVAAFASGVDVLSTYNSGQGATTTMSGTSMASPHLAGLAAYLWGLKGKTSPTDLCNLIKSSSLKDAVTGIPKTSKTKNYLAFNSAT